MRSGARWFTIAMFLVACARTGYVRRDDVARAAWWEVRSRHFLVSTNVTRELAQDRVRELEDAYCALSGRYDELVPERPPPPAPTQVVHFAACGDLADVKSDVVGFVSSTRDFRADRIVLTCESRFASQVMLHELAHVFNWHVLGSLPPWLDEGLATYYATLEVDGDEDVVGGNGPEVRVRGRSRAVFPTVDALFAVDAQHFHHTMSERLFYLAARNLVHLLSYRSDMQPRFLRYLRALASGAGHAAAWARAFAGVTTAALSHDLRLYGPSFSGRTRRLPHRHCGSGEVEVRRLGRGEANALWVHAQLVGTLGGDVAPLLAQLERAEREDPRWSDGAFWRAAVEASRRGRSGVARATELLRAHLRGHPADERGWFALVSLQLERATEGPRDQLEPALLALEPEVRALARVARSPTSLNFIAWYLGLRNRPVVGLGFARQAIAVDPACADCEGTLALLLYHSGHLDEAVRAQERAVQLTAERDRASEMRARLRAWRAAAMRRP